MTCIPFRQLWRAADTHIPFFLSFLFPVGYITVHTNVRYLSYATVPGRGWLLLIWNISAYIHAKCLIDED